MWPSQTSKVEEDGLRVLNLGGRDSDCLWRGHLMRWIDHENRYLSAWMGGLGCNHHRRLTWLEYWNVDLLFHLLDPERGCHLDRIRVWCWCRTLGALEEGDVGSSTTQPRRSRRRGDCKDSGLGNVLSDIGIAQYGVGIVQYILSNRASSNEGAQVLRQSRGVRLGSVRADKMNLAIWHANRKGPDVNSWMVGGPAMLVVGARH